MCEVDYNNSLCLHEKLRNNKQYILKETQYMMKQFILNKVWNETVQHVFQIYIGVTYL